MRKSDCRDLVVRSIPATAFAAVLVLSAGKAWAQDPVKVAPKNYKVLLENDTVRVCEVTAKPGEKIATHAHPDHVVYAVNPGKIKFIYPDGKTKEIDQKAGDVAWIKAETHAGENVGTTDIKVVVVELKKPASGKPGAKTPDADDQAKSSPETTKVLLENDRVRVMDTRIKPGGKLPMHAHPAHVVYSLTGGKMKGTTSPDNKSEERTLTAGQAFFSGPTTHAVENVGAAESHVVVFELKD